MIIKRKKYPADAGLHSVPYFLISISKIPFSTGTINRTTIQKTGFLIQKSCFCYQTELRIPLNSDSNEH